MPVSSPRSTAKTYLPPPVDSQDEAAHRKLLAQAIQDILGGKVNVTKSITLTANAASTTISDPRIGSTTAVVLVPTTSNAAAALATTYQTWPNAMAEAAVINHANNAQTDRTCVAVLIG